MMRTVDDVIRRLVKPAVRELPVPPYVPPREDVSGGWPKLGLAVSSMRDHTSNEGIEIFDGLERNGWLIAGKNRNVPLKDVDWVLMACRHVEGADPRTLLLQDKREWEGRTAGPGFDDSERYRNVGVLKGRPDIFKLTILKDAQNEVPYHRESADEIGAHAWVIYYHPRVVKHVAPFVRERHLIRTYHTIDPRLVPPYSVEARSGCILSGALSRVYPLRKRLAENVRLLYKTVWHRHPGYRRDGCHTPSFLKELSRFKVSICTSSIYGYALRKIVESTACGCRVLTDLPVDEVLPEIDGNLTRVSPNASPQAVSRILEELCATYDPERQRAFADAAISKYDYRVETLRLSKAVEELRRDYR